MADKIKESIKSKIENHEADKNTLHAFKQELANLAEELDKPLVFIIDELDRCRPDFAIRLIERTKHFFDIPKIVFVLVMNKPQLIQSVKKYYGYDSALNGDYFEKFIDYTVEFPTIGDDQLYSGVIKEQLYRIGEIADRDQQSEFFLWILSFQSRKKYHARELGRKINQYALLRTNDEKLNFILIAFIFDQNFDMSKYDLSKIIDELFQYFQGDDIEITRAYFVQQKILNDFNLDKSTICDMYENILSNEMDMISRNEWLEREHMLKQFLAIY